MKVLPALALLYAVGSGIGYLLGHYPRHRVESAWLIFAGLALLSLFARQQRPPELSLASFERIHGPLFLLAAIALYLPSVSVGQFSDDYILLSAGTNWNVFAAWEHVRPLPLLVWAGLSSLGLAAPWLLHLVNILLHGTNSFLCYRLSRELGANQMVALASSAVFLSFPGSVETVTWISGLQDVMMTTFVLASIIAALRQSEVRAFAFVVLGTLSKETAVCAPVLLVLIGFLRPISKRMILAMFAWCVVFALGRLYLQPAQGFLEPPSRYFLKELVVAVYGTLAVPWTEAQIASVPLAPILGLVAVAFLLGLALFSSERTQHSRVLLVSCAWVFLAAAPVYRYLYIAPDLQGSRYLYLPAVGWGLLLAWVGCRSEMRLGRAALGVLVMLGIGGTLLQQQRWREAASYRDDVLARALYDARRLDCTSPHFVNGPDNLNGVYVFRNGLNEAYAAANRASGTASATSCQMRWENEEFVRVR